MRIDQPPEPLVVPVLSAAQSQPDWIDAKASAKATRAARARQTSGRRRGVDPTTSDRDYSSDELEFMKAMQAYKIQSGRMFPTWSEVLEVLRGLGYDKDPEALPSGNDDGDGHTAA